MKKIGFVIPWYHKDIPGGAEMELRSVAGHLMEAGVEVEILTTCVKDFSSDWTENFFAEGMDSADDVPIRRFKVRKGNLDAFHQINFKLMHDIPITLEEEDVFLKEMVNSPDMYRYIRDYKDDYHVFIFMPYMFGTTYFGIQACLDKAVMIPCFHDENYAYFKRFRELFGRVRGIIYNAEPEREFANRIYDLRRVREIVMGIGIDAGIDGDGARFRDKYGISDPYILYAGRKDSAKNVDALIRYFAEYRKRNEGNLKLVLIGGGSIEIPPEVTDHVLDLGFLPTQDKFDACAGAEFLCQPSRHESFSLVIMESWLCGRPVLVNQNCEVTRQFAQDARAGLYFGEYLEFEGCVKYFLDHPDVAETMGKNGREFVQQKFDWDVIVEKYKEFLEKV